MKLRKADADILIPDGGNVEAALARTTHLGVGAHQDDLEVLAMHGILTCFGRRDLAFTTGLIAEFRDSVTDQLTTLRRT